MQSEISKLKIIVPLVELAKNYLYRSMISDALNVNENEDTINMNEDRLELIFGPNVDGKHSDGSVPPFYLSLTIHDQILHIAMLDTGASHNLMPKAIM